MCTVLTLSPSLDRTGPSAPPLLVSPLSLGPDRRSLQSREPVCVILKSGEVEVVTRAPTCSSSVNYL